jgi:ABC-type sugar transport system permease subunit
LVAPACLVLLIVLVLPSLFAFAYSFLKLNYTAPQGFGGLTNWKRAVFQPEMVGLLVRTAVFVAGSVALTIAVSLPIAHFLDRIGNRISTILQLVVIIPWVMSSIVAALLFRWTMLENIGIVSFIAEHLGAGWDPLLSPTQSMISMIVVASWRTAGFAVLLLLAGFKGVDRQLYESARIDGASRFQEFRYVALPGIRTQLIIVTVVLFMSNLNNVEVPLTVTNGGPGDATMVLPLRIYELAFSKFDFGGATAMAAAAMLLNVALVVVYLRLTFRKR